jgi:hydrogenase maturation protease
MRAIVCGYGNPSRQDDGAGHVLAPMIAAWLEERGADVRLECAHQLLPELAEDLADADLAVFVDASVSGEDGNDAEDRWGAVRELAPDPVLEGANLHSMGPEWLLDLMDTLRLRRPRAVLVTVAGVSFDFADVPTPLCLSRAGKAFDAFKSFLGRPTPPGSPEAPFRPSRT